MDDRLAWLAAASKGCHAEVTLMDGRAFAGVLSGLMPGDKNSAVTIRMAWPCAVRDATGIKRFNTPTSPPVKEMVFGEGQIAAVALKEVHQMSNHVSGFQTDTQVSGNLQMAERTLVRFDTSSAETSTDMSLGGGRHQGKWDQFEANARLTGTRAEELNLDDYSTKLDKSSKFYKDNAGRAAQLAREIESKGSSNRHIREERGMENLKDYDDFDEEEAYSAVVRDAPKKQSKDRNNGAWRRDRSSSLDQEDPAQLNQERFRVRNELISNTRRSGVDTRQRSPHMHNIRSPPGHKIPSPSSSPLGNSPLVGDAGRISALSLEATAPQLGLDHLRSFAQFKSQKNQEQGRLPSFTEETNSLKAFSKDLSTKSPKTGPSRVAASRSRAIPDISTGMGTQATPTTAAAMNPTPTANAPNSATKTTTALKKPSTKLKASAAVFVPRAAASPFVPAGAQYMPQPQAYPGQYMPGMPMMGGPPMPGAMMPGLGMEYSMGAPGNAQMADPNMHMYAPQGGMMSPQAPPQQQQPQHPASPHSPAPLMPNYRNTPPNQHHRHTPPGGPPQQYGMPGVPQSPGGPFPQGGPLPYRS